MSRFLSRAVSFRRRIINATSPSTFQYLLCVQSQWFSVRYANSIASDGRSFTASYLIDTCGFSPKQAEAASMRVSFETRERPDLVINFLKSHGFSRPLILRLIRKAPWFLRSDPEKTFLPRIEFFKSRGVSSSHISKLIFNCPNIMRRSLSNQLIPSFDFFRDLFQSDENVIKALEHCSGIFSGTRTSAAPKIEILREAGVPQSNIIKYLQFYSRTFTSSRPGRIKKIVEEVKELGFDPLKLQFLVAVHVCLCLKKSTLAKKADVYKKWGFSDHDILTVFRKHPLCMAISVDKIDAAMEFFVNKLGCDSSTLSKYPAVITLSLEKRIVPRGVVIQVLLSKGLVKKKTLLRILKLTEKDFLRRFVLCHEHEASELLELYQSKLDLTRKMNR